MTDLFDHRWRQGPSNGDVTQKLGNLVRVLRAAVGQQKHGGFRGRANKGIQPI